MQYRIALVFACVAWCFLTSASASSCHYIKTVARKLGVDLRTIWDAEVHINGNSINLGQVCGVSSARCPQLPIIFICSFSADALHYGIAMRYANAIYFLWLLLWYEVQIAVH